jgi:hypothetical protein
LAQNKKGSADKARGLATKKIEIFVEVSPAKKTFNAYSY